MRSREERVSRLAVERLILWHLWACVPFALPWLLMPGVFGHRAETASEVGQMRLLFLLVGISLAARTFILLKKIAGPWPYVWPLVDIAFITVAARIGYAEPDSWIIVMYVLPVLQASATLDSRWSMAVATIAAVACGAVNGFSNLVYSYFLFRLAILLIVASLVTRLARSLVRARSRLEIANYRSDLASEMHDGLQQYLGAIAMQLEMVERDPERAKSTATLAKSTARQASDELRLMLHRLRSPLLDQGTLEDALRFQAHLFQERTGVAIEVTQSGSACPLAPKTEHALLRIAQEALSNVAKHADAKHVGLELSYEPSTTVLRIQDDGSGFDPSAAMSGMGMETMRNRAQTVGGEIRIESAAGGTVLEVRVPTA